MIRNDKIECYHVKSPLQSQRVKKPQLHSGESAIKRVVSNRHFPDFRRHAFATKNCGNYSKIATDNWQNALSTFDKGNANVMQVIRLPAYEIYLHSAHSPVLYAPVRWTTENQVHKSNSVPFVHNKEARFGKYPFPKPFGFDSVHSKDEVFNTDSKRHNLQRTSASLQGALPDLSLYYAKKREIDGTNYNVKRNYEERRSRAKLLTHEITTHTPPIPKKINFFLRIRKRSR
ncbi:uncharacterized protein LOC132705425 isoform X2 [Cylas formicarius]|nr:uncharacterized protein LOC132705425 isoform X2 [Cylas formicarius]XP_060531991.1 uncharacterized protein LOC132705425 isoform X2 [Cylas formicarius]XP_060531992.1 uncharacterized protein LOC132705425 isoform X2 [Cylas formicarius]XP_060531993.1 uncharacterized protein LOC132705425 isoform X2 [Cylas formicarius]